MAVPGCCLRADSQVSNACPAGISRLWIPVCVLTDLSCSCVEVLACSRRRKGLGCSACSAKMSAAALVTDGFSRMRLPRGVAPVLTAENGEVCTPVCHNKTSSSKSAKECLKSSSLPLSGAMYSCALSQTAARQELGEETGTDYAQHLQRVQR